MTQKVILIVLMVFSFFQFSSVALAQEVSETEEADVKIYVANTLLLQDEKGNSTEIGRKLDFVKKRFELDQLKYQVRMTNWARVLQEVSSQSNAIIFNMARTSEREENYHWVFHLDYKENDELRLYHRNEEKFNNLSKENILAADFTALCINGAANCSQLLEFGFPNHRITRIPNLLTMNQEQMTLRKRADYFISYESDVLFNLNLLGEKPDALISEINLPKSQRYVTAPKSHNPELLDRLKRALNDP